MLIASNHGALVWDRQCAHSRHDTCMAVLSGAPACHCWEPGFFHVATMEPPAGFAPQCCYALD